jgi:hypothetical protein
MRWNLNNQAEQQEQNDMVIQTVMYSSRSLVSADIWFQGGRH